MADCTQHGGELPGQMELPYDLPGDPGGQNTAAEDTVRTELNRLRERNRAMFDQLGKRSLMLDPAGVLSVRLNTLLEMILDPSARLHFETAFEVAMHDVLTEAVDQARSKPDLLVPGGLTSADAMRSGPPGLVLPG